MAENSPKNNLNSAEIIGFKGKIQKNSNSIFWLCSPFGEKNKEKINKIETFLNNHKDSTF